MEAQIIVHSSRKTFAPVAHKVKKVLIAALGILRKNNVAIELYLLTNAEMRAINNATRGKDAPTNVLSFEADAFPRADIGVRCYLGEIYLAPGVIRARGEDAAFLALHGLLHLFQYTHEKNRDRIAMEKEEDRLLAKLAGRL